jgi:transmembrane sensor
MEVAYDGHDRRLRLIQGRGRFTVAHDPGHPFIVEAAGGRVIAHGTIFDVEVVQSVARVALLQGAVEVRAERTEAGRRQVDLVAGQRVELASRSISRPLAIMPAEQRWPNDMLELDGVALSRATDMFNRTSRTRVTVAPATARGRTVSGAFRRDDPEGFAAQIAETFGLSVEHGAGGELTLRGS